jgi:Tfp pilus assembly protein PilV
MIALSVLAFGLLGVAFAQIQALNYGSRGRHTSTATGIAQSQYELLLRMPFSDPQLTATGLWAAVPWIVPAAPLVVGDVPVIVVQGDDSVTTELIYNVQYRVNAAATPELRNIDLRVDWTEDGQGAKSVNFSGIIVDNDR